PIGDTPGAVGRNVSREVESPRTGAGVTGGSHCSSDSCHSEAGAAVREGSLIGERVVGCKDMDALPKRSGRAELPGGRGRRLSASTSESKRLRGVGCAVTPLPPVRDAACPIGCDISRKVERPWTGTGTAGGTHSRGSGCNRKTDRGGRGRRRSR